jgi:NitT/TauT family transport system substrate-binding protein
MGSLNMVTCTHERMIKDNPDLVRAFLKMHRQATEFAEKSPEEKITMSMAKLGAQRPALEKAVSNVTLTWRMDETMITRTKTYAQQMLELKQIRALPDFAKFLSPKFNDEVAKSA